MGDSCRQENSNINYIFSRPKDSIGPIGSVVWSKQPRLLDVLNADALSFTREGIMDQRDAKREVVDLEVAGTFKGKPCRALLYDLSMDGCMVHTGGRFVLRAGDTIRFELPYAGATDATVIWTKGQFGGAKFTGRLDQAVVTKLGFRPHAQPDTAFRGHSGRPVTRIGERFSL